MSEGVSGSAFTFSAAGGIDSTGAEPAPVWAGVPRIRLASSQTCEDSSPTRSAFSTLAVRRCSAGRSSRTMAAISSTVMASTPRGPASVSKSPGTKRPRSSSLVRADGRLPSASGSSSAAYTAFRIASFTGRGGSCRRASGSSGSWRISSPRPSRSSRLIRKFARLAAVTPPAAARWSSTTLDVASAPAERAASNSARRRPIGLATLHSLGGRRASVLCINSSAPARFPRCSRVRPVSKRKVARSRARSRMACSTGSSESSQAGWIPTRSSYVMYVGPAKARINSAVLARSPGSRAMTYTTKRSLSVYRRGRTMGALSPRRRDSTNGRVRPL